MDAFKIKLKEDPLLGLKLCLKLLLNRNIFMLITGLNFQLKFVYKKHGEWIFCKEKVSIWSPNLLF
jgi:hypothetical protein